MNSDIGSFQLPSAAIIFGWILFGSISIISIGYGKMKQEWYPAVVGVAMGVYPYFVPNGPLFWVLGTALTAALFVPRRYLP